MLIIGVYVSVHTSLIVHTLGCYLSVHALAHMGLTSV